MTRITIAKLREFIQLTKTAEAIRDSGAEWKTVYNAIFSSDLSGQVSGLHIDFEWYDPDTSYEDDVRAYVSALRRKADDLQKIVDAVDRVQEDDM